MPAASSRAEFQAADGVGEIRGAVNRRAESERRLTAYERRRFCGSPLPDGRGFATRSLRSPQTSAEPRGHPGQEGALMTADGCPGFRARQFRRLCRHVPKVLRQIRFGSYNFLIPYERKMVR